MSDFETDANGILTNSGEGFVEEYLHQTQHKQLSFVRKKLKLLSESVSLIGRVNQVGGGPDSQLNRLGSQQFFFFLFDKPSI
ncbi:MAG: hypothetical protein O2983_06650 [Planctomycetota bacterium]|nr:hypothetical protein [Planctomycetota bacterium]MDA0917767.1 hypothetical protein [Planctomycetota bacterium]MDA1159275.1 hypothetical protein [Planctomycetota bacterium]